MAATEAEPKDLTLAQELRTRAAEAARLTEVLIALRQRETADFATLQALFARADNLLDDAIQLSRPDDIAWIKATDEIEINLKGMLVGVNSYLLQPGAGAQTKYADSWADIRQALALFQALVETPTERAWSDEVASLIEEAGAVNERLLATEDAETARFADLQAALHTIGEQLLDEQAQPESQADRVKAESRLLQAVLTISRRGLALGLLAAVLGLAGGAWLYRRAISAHHYARMFQALVEHIPLSVWLYRRDGTAMFANQATFDTFGIADPAEVLGRYNVYANATEAGKPLLKRFDEVWAGGSVQRFRHELDMTRVAYKTTRHDRAQCLTTLFRLPENGEPSLVALQEDVTEQVRSQQERERLAAQVYEQAQQMQQVLATVPVGVVLLDADGHLLSANPVAERELAVLARRENGALVGLGDRSLAELLTPLPDRLWHEVKVGASVFEVIARSTDDSAQARQWALVIQDVTGERRIQAQLQHQERLAAVGQLAAGIAHDFNNIMAAIVLYAGILKQAAGLTDRDRQRVDTINQQAWHATRLIEQILDFSRRAVLERRPLDLLPLLKEQVKLLERTLPEHIRWKLSYGQDEFTIHADPTRMQQMLTNLAVNARDAMPDGGTLRIRLERITVEPDQTPPLPEMGTGNWVVLSVTDTGMGIAPEVLPRIFEPFYTTKAPGKGSGLGLAQVHGIVGQHGGRIDVKTQIGKGTTFTIYLPALEARPIEQPAPDAAVITRGQGETVLIVEDDSTVRPALTTSLAAWNYQALEATNGQEALAVVEKHSGQIALVLSDVVMPVMGGVALLHALRQKGHTMPVVLLTGHPMEQTELDGLRAQGLSAWLSKPPRLEQLAQTIASALHETTRET